MVRKLQDKLGGLFGGGKKPGGGNGAGGGVPHLPKGGSIGIGVIAGFTPWQTQPGKGLRSIKGVEIGDGFEVAGRRGSVAHDPISWDADAGEYTPMDLIMEQWDEFFQDSFVETHQDITCPQDDTQKLTDVFTGDTSAGDWTVARPLFTAGEGGTTVGARQLVPKGFVFCVE